MNGLTRSHPNDPARRRSIVGRFVFFIFAVLAFSALVSPAQDLNLDSLARALQTGNTEQKREALFQIRNLKSEAASRTALPALRDGDPIVRATAAASVVFLPKPEAINALTPLLSDRDLFVRKEAAYALGNVESQDAAGPLIGLLHREKDIEVRSAGTAALGGTGNPSAVEHLLTVLRRKPTEAEEFLRRSAARSIGQIAQILRVTDSYVVTPQNFLPGGRKAGPVADLSKQFPIFNTAIVPLGNVLQNRSEADDTRREAAFALGAIGSRSAVSALQNHQNSPDPYLAEIAKEALLKLGQAAPK